MAVKERSQIKGTDAQIKAFAGHNGVLAFATDTKSLHVLSGTAGTTTEFLPSKVGDIKLYAGSNVPDGWFRCDGSTIADMATNYPKLYAVLGTNVLPNYSGRTIYGASSDINQQVAAGLPNITGNFIFNAGSTVALWSASAEGAFYADKHPETNLKGGVYNSPATPYEGRNMVSFNASRASSIYGASTTVQPPAVKVAVLIRHD